MIHGKTTNRGSNTAVGYNLNLYLTPKQMAGAHDMMTTTSPTFFTLNTAGSGDYINPAIDDTVR